MGEAHSQSHPMSALSSLCTCLPPVPLAAPGPCPPLSRDEERCVVLEPREEAGAPALEEVFLDGGMAS